jgi:hypothetical protein
MATLQDSTAPSSTETKAPPTLVSPITSLVIQFLAIACASTVLFDYLLTESDIAGAHSSAPDIFLVRSIGNPLPPRHDPEQALLNLEFTLENEPHFKGVEKHWVVNRIFNATLQDRVVHLLSKNGQNYTTIPFRLEEYAQIKQNFFYDQPIPDVVHSYEYHSLRQDEKCANLNFKRSAWTVEGLLKVVQKKCWNMHDRRKAFIDEAIQTEKNLYVTNQNVARNLMIDIGVSSGAKWILPWDGNSFLTEEGFREVEGTLQQLDASKVKYAYTPMAQVQQNDEVLSPTYQPDPTEEPQLIFHRNATARFHPKLRYGRRNKVELLQRIKVPGPWLLMWSPYLPWEREAFSPLLQRVSDLNGEAVNAGWVTSLSSGRQHLKVEAQLHARDAPRYQSMDFALQQLDDQAVRQVHQYSPDRLLFYKNLEDFRNVTEDKPEYEVVKNLILQAELCLNQRPFRITDKKALPPSGSLLDYYSLDPHILQNVEHKNVRASMQDESRFDRERMLDMECNTTVLALAYYITGNTEYGEVAAQNVRDWFTGPNKMKPHLSFAQVGSRKPSYGILEFKDMYHFLDAVRIAHKFLSNKELTEVKTWFRAYLRWLDGSQRGQHAYTASNHHGVWFDVQVTAIAAYVNDTAKMLSVLDRSVSRLTAQVSSYGAIPNERNHSTCEHDQMMFLQGWTNLGRLGESVGRNLWDEYHEGLMNMSALCRASFFAVPYMQNRHVCPGNLVKEDEQRWWPLLDQALRHCAELKRKSSFGVADWLSQENKVAPTNVYVMPTLFKPDTGIAPFWQLGLDRQLSTPVIYPNSTLDIDIEDELLLAQKQQSWLKLPGSSDLKNRADTDTESSELQLEKNKEGTMKTDPGKASGEQGGNMPTLKPKNQEEVKEKEKEIALNFGKAQRVADTDTKSQLSKPEKKQEEGKKKGVDSGKDKIIGETEIKTRTAKSEKKQQEVKAKPLDSGKEKS